MLQDTPEFVFFVEIRAKDWSEWEMYDMYSDLETALEVSKKIRNHEYDTRIRKFQEVLL
jgi:hypothetical protein